MRTLRTARSLTSRNISSAPPARTLMPSHYFGTCGRCQETWPNARPYCALPVTTLYQYSPPACPCTPVRQFDIRALAVPAPLDYHLLLYWRHSRFTSSVRALKWEPSTMRRLVQSLLRPLGLCLTRLQNAESQD